MSGPLDRDEDAGPGFLGYFVRHRTAANLLLVLMLAAGVYAALNLRAQFFPDIVRETVTVSASWEGAGASDIDDGVVALLEPPLLAVPGVENVSSRSSEGSASVVIEFEEGWDMSRATDEVQTAVDGVTTLPSEVESPTVRRNESRERVINIAITGDVGIDRLVSYADEVVARLFREGVPKTSVSGIPDRTIAITPSEATLLRHNMTLTEVADAVTRGVSGVPGGDVDARSSRVRAGEDLRSVGEIGAIRVRTLDDGSQLQLRDIATVRDGGDNEGIQVFRSGLPTVIVSVQRDLSGDAIGIEEIAKKVVADIAPTLPENVEIVTGRSRAEPILKRRDMLIKNGATGLILVLALLFLFLSARTAFWVAAGIPISIAATLGIMYASGQTLNMISMFALIISLGIIVDDAIVVGEHADSLRRKGHSPAGAAANAARRMAAPVFSASITTIIAFSALTVISGRFGSLIAAIPMVIAAVLIASLIESFLILPAHMRHALAARNQRPWYDAPSRVVNRGFDVFRQRVFRPLMRLAVQWRYITLTASIGLLLYSISMVTDGKVGWRFFDRPEMGTLFANVVMNSSASRADTKAMLDEMDRALTVVNNRYLEEFGVDTVEFSQGTLGDTVGWRFSAGTNVSADLKGGFEAGLIDSDDRPFSSFKFLRDWNAEIKVSPDVENFSLRSARGGPGGDSIDVRMSGADALTLKNAAEALKAGLSGINGVTGLDDSLVFDKTELVLTLTPRGEALGFEVTDLGRELRARLTGIEAAEFARDARQVQVMVSPPTDEIGADYLETAHLRAPNGSIVTLGEVAKITPRQSFASINREGGQRIVSVTGEVTDDPLVFDAVYEALETQIMPAIAADFGVVYDLAGAAQDEEEFLTGASIGFMACLVGIYLTLAWVFASWVRPFVLMLVIPFGFIGAVWGHYLWDLNLSMFSVVGLIGMAGIIINDSIVLVTTIDEYAEKRGMMASIVDAASDRLRAVLLTTLTTVGGLAPLLYETSTQALFLKPTVVTLAFGLGFGVVLVLFITPCVAAIEHDIRMSLRSMRRYFGRPGKIRRRLNGVRRMRNHRPHAEPTIEAPAPTLVLDRPFGRLPDAAE